MFRIDTATAEVVGMGKRVTLYASTDTKFETMPEAAEVVGVERVTEDGQFVGIRCKLDTGISVLMRPNDGLWIGRID